MPPEEEKEEREEEEEGEEEDEEEEEEEEDKKNNKEKEELPAVENDILPRSSRTQSSHRKGSEGNIVLFIQTSSTHIVFHPIYLTLDELVQLHPQPYDRASRTKYSLRTCYRRSTSAVSYEPELPQMQGKKYWNDEANLALLSLWGKVYIKNQKNGKKNISHKAYEKMALSLERMGYDITPAKCSQRVRTFTRVYRKV